VRAVLDANVLISSTLSRRGASAQAIRKWQEGAFDLVISPELVSELQRAFNYPKVRKLIDAQESHQLVSLLERDAIVAADPDLAPPVASRDSGDNYLLALAAATQALLVTHDADLLALRDAHPVRTPQELLDLLREKGG